jgi:endonuclease/exonuclease/phosphatase family metal-dependent hydrolase
MPTTHAPTNPGFWRCVKCGTPNPATLYLTTCVGCGFPRPAPGFESRADAPRDQAAPPPVPPSHTLLAAVAGYGLVLIAVFLLMWGVGDAWWPGFVLTISPRAIFLIPLVPLGVWAWRARRARIGAVVLAEALFVAGPLMGFVVPWGRLTARAGGPTVRIMTFNRGAGSGLPFDAADFLRYLERHRIDVVCFQEADRDPTLERVLDERDWHRDRSRSIASRFPIAEDYPRSEDLNEGAVKNYSALLHRVRLRGPGGREFVVGSLHMPTSRYAFQRFQGGEAGALTSHLLWWNAELIRMFALLTDLGDLPILVGGDFNNGPDASRLADLRESGLFQSAFDSAGWGWGYTRPTEFAWARIDHILANSPWTVTSCWVGPAFGSDHKSMVAEVALPAKP